MLQLEVPAAGLARWAHAHDLPTEDRGYLLHRLRRDAPGTILGFEVQACPIARTNGGDGRKLRELDVFLHRTLAAPKEEPLERDAVYRAWLDEKLLAAGAEAMAARVHRLDQVPLVRRTHPAAPRRLAQTRDGRRVMPRRPDVTFRGTLRVSEPERFAQLLATGLGRHRAFGYGMLLLRPAGPT